MVYHLRFERVNFDLQCDRRVSGNSLTFILPTLFYFVECTILFCPYFATIYPTICSTQEVETRMFGIQVNIHTFPFVYCFYLCICSISPFTDVTTYKTDH